MNTVKTTKMETMETLRDNPRWTDEQRALNRSVFKHLAKNSKFVDYPLSAYVMLSLGGTVEYTIPDPKNPGSPDKLKLTPGTIYPFTAYHAQDLEQFLAVQGTELLDVTPRIDLGALIKNAYDN